MPTNTETRVIKLDLDLGNYTSQIDRLEKELKGLNTEARKASKSLDGIGKEAVKTNKNLGTMNKTMGRTLENSRALNRAINSLRNVFAALFALRLAEGFISEIQAVDNQLQTVTNSTEEFAEAQARLLGVAQEVRQSYEGTVKLYARITRANDELGLSQDQIIKITTNVGKALAAQGASAQEARSALLQISQAFGSGVLAGEEFRAVAESAPILLQDLADSLGVSRGALKGMAADQLLTAEVLANAWENPRITLEAFGKTLPTLGQALTVLSDQFKSFVRDANDSTGAFGRLAQGVLILADNIGLLTTAVAALLGLALANWVVGLASNVTILTTSLTALRASMALNIAVAGTYAGTITLVGNSFIFAAAAVKLFAKATIVFAILYEGATKIMAINDALKEMNKTTDDLGLTLQLFARAFIEGMYNGIATLLTPLDYLITQLNKIPGIDLGPASAMFTELAEKTREEAFSLIRVNELMDEILAKPKAAKGGKTVGGLTKEEIKEFEKAWESVAKTLSDLQLQVDANAQGVSLAELQFRLLAESAGLVGEALEGVVGEWKKLTDQIKEDARIDGQIKTFNEALDAARPAIQRHSTEVLKMVEAAKLAGKSGEELAIVLTKMNKTYVDSTEEQQAFASAMESMETPAQKFGKQMELLSESQGYANLTSEEQIRLMTQLTQEYIDSTDAAKAFNEEQERIAKIQKEILDTTRGGIIGNRDSALQDVNAAETTLQEDQGGTLRLEQIQAFEAERIKIIQDANQQIIENGTMTMQVLGMAAEDFASGFGTAITDTALGADDAFSDFAESFIQNIGNMVLELLVIIPLLEAVKSLISGTTGTSNFNIQDVSTSDIMSGNFAKGGAFAANSNVIPFAKGGVVNQPTPFMFAKGGVPALGVAGEAGAEAILPLSRGKDGKLGVSGGTTVNVNVVNEVPGVEVQTSSRSTPNGEEITMMVTQAVRDGMQRGMLDDVMGSNFGVRRRGQ